MMFYVFRLSCSCVCVCLQGQRVTCKSHQVNIKRKNPRTNHFYQRRCGGGGRGGGGAGGGGGEGGGEGGGGGGGGGGKEGGGKGRGARRGCERMRVWGGGAILFELSDAFFQGGGGFFESLLDKIYSLSKRKEMVFKQN